MIFEANIISSASISEEDFLSALEEIGAEIAIESDGSRCAEFHRDNYSLIARMLNSDFDCFEEADLGGIIRRKLGGEMCTLLGLEFGEGAEAQALALTIGRKIGDRWPIVLDNGRGVILGHDELKKFASPS
ncbi:hypothetical protein [Massilia sp. YIM B04103]|uniref:hypothetical protein n=1 Tax=Massilia sp. YIM B04103 TaxID=2963106 RepID=UPI00210C87F6|nr:hypothetical protein [Massilia sp. YIM B04103]